MKGERPMPRRLVDYRNGVKAVKLRMSICFPRCPDRRLMRHPHADTRVPRVIATP